MEVPPHALEISYDAALLKVEQLPNDAISSFQAIISHVASPSNDDATQEVILRVKEHAIYQLASLYTTTGREADLHLLLTSLRPFFLTLPKAKTGKIIRSVIDMVSKVPPSATTSATTLLALQATLCQECITWCNVEKHTFLRQRIEARYAAILFDQASFQAALDLITRLCREIKKLDDKQLLVEIHLVESKLNHALRNLPKAKSALTAARSLANSIYVVPKVQAAIDMMSGTLHTEEKDYKTAFSYFLEGFEAMNQMKMSAEALVAFKYMLLSKIASGQAAEVTHLMNSKNGLKYAGIDLNALATIAHAHEVRSLEDFQAARSTYGPQLTVDPLMARHLDYLYDKLLDANLLKIIEPYSVVEVAFVATLIKLPTSEVERKLSQMILDKKFFGTLDQGQGHLIVHEHSPEDAAYTSGLELIAQVEAVVTSLFTRADHLQVA